MNQDREQGRASVANEPDRNGGGPGAQQRAMPHTGDKARVQGALVSVLTAGRDKPYALGFASSLIGQGVAFDFIGSDEVDSPELHQNPKVKFLNLRGDQDPNSGLVNKVWRVLIYYARLLGYAARTEARVFHILWNNKLELLDRTVLLLYYRLLGKRLVFTAHNVNVRRRDGHDSLLNRLTLSVQYRFVDHVFVHTERMKQELQDEFGVSERKISVIPFGINSTVPNTALTPVQARQRFGLGQDEKVVLFFGNIAPYKGLEYLVEAMGRLTGTGTGYRLIIAGRPKNCPTYWESVQRRITDLGLGPNVIERIEYVPDAETEVFFKAADVLVLPYTHVFQSGVLFLGYNFGLPVVASDVGSIKDDIVSGKTGFVCRPKDSADLAEALETYFASELFRELDVRRPEIRDYAEDRHSWTKVAEITTDVYRNLLPEVKI